MHSSLMISGSSEWWTLIVKSSGCWRLVVTRWKIQQWVPWSWTITSVSWKMESEKVTIGLRKRASVGKTWESLRHRIRWLSRIASSIPSEMHVCICWLRHAIFMFQDMFIHLPGWFILIRFILGFISTMVTALHVMWTGGWNLCLTVCTVSSLRSSGAPHTPDIFQCSKIWFAQFVSIIYWWYGCSWQSLPPPMSLGNRYYKNVIQL